MSKVTSVEVKKTGSGPKGPWTLYNITVDDNDSKYISGFAKVEVGDTVEVSQEERGEYLNWVYKVPKKTTTSTNATESDGGSDKRVLKLLTVVAEQMGVDKDVIMNILTGEE